MAFPLKFTLLASVLLLAACRSDPIQFHTLTPVSYTHLTLPTNREV